MNYKIQIIHNKDRVGIHKLYIGNILKRNGRTIGGVRYKSTGAVDIKNKNEIREFEEERRVRREKANDTIKWSKTCKRLQGKHVLFTYSRVPEKIEREIFLQTLVEKVERWTVSSQRGKKKVEIVGYAASQEKDNSKIMDQFREFQTNKHFNVYMEFDPKIDAGNINILGSVEIAGGLLKADFGTCRNQNKTLDYLQKGVKYLIYHKKREELLRERERMELETYKDKQAARTREAITEAKLKKLANYSPRKYSWQDYKPDVRISSFFIHELWKSMVLYVKGPVFTGKTSYRKSHRLRRKQEREALGEDVTRYHHDNRKNVMKIRALEKKDSLERKKRMLIRRDGVSIKNIRKTYGWDLLHVNEIRVRKKPIILEAGTVIVIINDRDIEMTDNKKAKELEFEEQWSDQVLTVDVEKDRRMTPQDKDLLDLIEKKKKCIEKRKAIRLQENEDEMDRCYNLSNLIAIEYEEKLDALISKREEETNEEKTKKWQHFKDVEFKKMLGRVNRNEKSEQPEEPKTS